MVQEAKLILENQPANNISVLGHGTVRSGHESIDRTASHSKSVLEVDGHEC